MAEESETPPPKKKVSGLSGKWHGVPKPVLLLGGGLALYLGYRWYKNRQSSSTTTTPSTTSTGNTTGTGADTGSYGGGGGYGGGWGGYGNPTQSAPTTSPTTSGDVAITNPNTGVVTTLTPSPTTPGDYQAPQGYQVFTDPLLSAQGGPTGLGTNQAAANIAAADQAAGMVFTNPVTVPTKTTPTGVPAQQAAVNQALAISEANLKKAQAAEKAHPSAANAAAVKAHESQVKAGR